MVLARRGAPDTPALRPQEHRFCSVGRMQPEDLQQPGVCCPPGSVCQPGLRGCLPADTHVHHSHELRQRLGSRVQVSTGGGACPRAQGRQGPPHSRAGPPQSGARPALAQRTEAAIREAATCRLIRAEQCWPRASDTCAPCHLTLPWAGHCITLCGGEGAEAQGRKVTCPKPHRSWKG